MAKPKIYQVDQLQTMVGSMNTAITAAHNQANSAYSQANTASNTSNLVLKTGDTMTGNLTFSGTGLRILGDMSNATIGNRLSFQNSTTNAVTRIGAIPNGTATESGYNFYNTSAVTTGEFGQLYITSSEVTLRSAVLAGGSFLPMTFYTGGSERMRLDTSGNLGIGTTTVAAGGLLTLNRAPAAAFGTPMLQVGGASFTAGGYYSIGLGFTDATYTEPPGEIVFITDSSSGGTNGAIAFGTRSVTTNTAVTERMRIDSSGNIGIGGTADGYAKTQIRGTLPTASTISVGCSNIGIVPSGSTGAAYYYATNLNTQAASFTCASVYHYYTYQNSIGAGSTVTNQYGYFADASLTGATNNYGFYSNIASGSNRWNFYAAGTAQNYFAGNVGIGTTSPSNKLEVSGTARATFFYALAAGTDDSANFGNSQSNIRIGGDGATMRMNTSPWSLTLIAPSVIVSGALSKSSGSFKIDHPLPEKSNTHYLVHSFIEGPQADLIYSGKIQLENGVANINIDAHSKMTEGTFVLLCRDIRCFTTNESDWNAVRGSVTGNILTIECQNISSNATVSWIVIGERQDKHMLDTNWTDDAGKVIVEPEKT